jgi:DNA-binding response OmpR family regulator
MNVLILDDSRTVPSLIERTISAYGYLPHTITSNHNIKSYLAGFPIALVIINTSLMHADSMELCTHIRKNYPKMIIMGVQTRGTWEDRVKLLQHGADDCITFPFPTQELIARILALRRRPKRSRDTTLSCGKIVMKPSQRRAYYNENPIRLTRKEYHLLEYLMRNNERVVSRSELLDHVWDYKQIINSNTVDVHIQKIRRKIREAQVQSPVSDHTGKSAGKTVKQKPENGNSGTLRQPSSGKYNYNGTEIKTVHGIGYRIEGNIPKRDRSETETLTEKQLPELK